MSQGPHLRELRAGGEDWQGQSQKMVDEICLIEEDVTTETYRWKQLILTRKIGISCLIN